MRPRALKHYCLAIAQIIAIAVCLSAPSAAQTNGQTASPMPGPESSPAPASTNTTFATFSENLTNLAKSAAGLSKVIENELEGEILPWLENLSLTMAALIMIAAFAKLWKENSGAGVDLFWWFARLCVIFALLGNGPKIINTMYNFGQKLAVGDNDGPSALSAFSDRQEAAFSKSYDIFTNNLFTAKGASDPMIPGGVTGVISNTKQNVVDKFETISRSMPLLFDAMNISRSVISFGDLFLILLGKFLIIAMRLAAPVMIALAIDRSLAQQVTYPYLWGVVVLTLVWPVVMLIIKSIAYMSANIGLSLGDKTDKNYFEFDNNSLGIISAEGQHPEYVVFFAAVVMFVSGLFLWMSPYIAYQLSTGRMYDVAAATVSMAGSGIQYYAVGVAGSVLKQAVASGAASSGFASKSSGQNTFGFRLGDFMKTHRPLAFGNQQAPGASITGGITKIHPNPVANPVGNIQPQTVSPTLRPPVYRL